MPPKKEKASKDTKASKELKESKDAKASKELNVSKDAKASKELKESKDPKKVTKSVKFDKDANTNILKSPVKEKYPNTENLNLDEEELEKETELETEIEETEKELEEIDDNIDEDHEVNDEVEYDDQEIEEIDDLFDDDDKPKKKNGKNKKKLEDDDEKIDDDDCEYDYSEIYDEKKENPITIVESSQRITLPKLTKYEKVRLIGTRAKQISLGAKVMIKNTEGLNAIEIAKLELEHKMIPMKVKRLLPDNRVEIWKLSELDLDN
jgi:DNA-directed RNA polymerase I, II, and III subunit RPABC2